MELKGGGGGPSNGDVLSARAGCTDQDLHFGLHTGVYWATTVNGTFAGCSVSTTLVCFPYNCLLLSPASWAQQFAGFSFLVWLRSPAFPALALDEMKTFHP